METNNFTLWLDEKIQEYIPQPCKRNGNDINFRCPICGDSQKSKLKMRGHYYINTHSYYCFNCDTALTGTGLLQALSGEDFNSLKSEYLKIKYKDKSTKKKTINTNSNSQEFNFFNLTNSIPKQYQNALTANAFEYLDKRKIFDSPFFNNKFYSYINEDNQEYLVIPWIINGIECYYQINDFNKYGDRKYIFPTNKDKLIYGLDNVDCDFPYLILFEGVFDSIFVKNGLAIGGKKLTNLQKAILKTRYPNHELVLALDNDTAGITSMLKAAKQDKQMKYFNWAKILKTDCKDINEYVQTTNNPKVFEDETFIKSGITNAILLKLSLNMK
jgi:hypothetical protein